MRIILIGSEYAGKSTLAGEITRWLEENMGRGQFGGYGWHDHFVVPYLSHPGPNAEEHAQQIRSMSPSLLQMHSIHMIEYHMQMLADDHFLAINWYYGDAVYAPLYYGYGRPGEYADVRWIARHSDAKIMKMAPDTVLVLVKATPAVIRKRMSENPRPDCILKDDDVDSVVQRFEEEYTMSLLRRRFTVDTSDASVQDTFKEFLRCMEPHIPGADRMALIAHERVFRPATQPE
jgi:thymidylate kinase